MPQKQPEQLQIELELQEALYKPSMYLQAIRSIPIGPLGRPWELQVEVELLNSYQPHEEHG